MFFKEKTQNPSCIYLSDSLVFDRNNNVKFCPFNDIGIVFNDFDGIWLNIDKINNFRENLLKTPQEKCNNCLYKRHDNKHLKELKYLFLSNWNYCYVNCTYCDFPKEEDLIKAKHYDVLPSVKALIDKKLVTKNTQIIFECGDATVHPEFDKILYFFINYGMENIIINTPAFRYCESISQAIGENRAVVIVPFDSGCPYIFEKIKGLNKFDIAIGNIKRYLSHQEPSQTRVILKYTIVQGINDNQKEILDWYILSRDLGIKKLGLDIDEKFFNTIKNSVPDYLKELILFAKNISAYNNIEIEFLPRLAIIYDIIKKSSER